MAAPVQRNRAQSAAQKRSMDGILPRQSNYVRRPALGLQSAPRRRARPTTAPQRTMVGHTQSYGLAQAQLHPHTTALTPAAKHHVAWWRPVLVAGLLLLVGFIGISRVTGDSQHPASLMAFKRVAAAAGSIVSKKSAADTAPQPNAQLAADLNTAVNSQPGLQTAATLIDLNTGLTYNAGASSTMFTTASTGKMLSVFTYMHQVELGKATLSQTIGGDSAQDIIQRMIVYSDNNAWAALNSYLTLPVEQSYIRSLGVNVIIQPENWQITSAGMARLYQLLYQGKLMSPADQAIVYNYMSHTTVTNLIQAVMPAGTTVYHKYGQILGVLHDASIVEYKGHNFVLVVYTNNPDGTTDMYSNQVALIHSVATAAITDITAD